MVSEHMSEVESFTDPMIICNHHDPFAVAVCKGMTVVGHMPREISAVCYVCNILGRQD